MSQQDPKEGVSTTHSISFRLRFLQPELDQCRNLAHLEAIPFRHGGRLSIVRRACVALQEHTWCVVNTNLDGPRTDICYRIPGPKNSWLARLSDRSMLDELTSIIFAHKSKDQKGSDYIHYLSDDVPESDEPGISLIIECLEGPRARWIEIIPIEAYHIHGVQDEVGFRILIDE